MPPQAAAIAISAKRERNSLLQHQSPSTGVLECNKITAQDQFTVIQNSGSDDNLLAAVSKLPMPRLSALEAPDDLGLSSMPWTMASPPATSPSIQFQGSIEGSQAETLVSPRSTSSRPDSSRRSTHDDQGCSQEADEDGTVTLPGQTCLRGTASQDALMKLIEKHVMDHQATLPNVQTMNLADALFTFYEDRAQAPTGKPHKPTLVDLQTILIPILGDNLMSHELSILQGNKCMNAFRAIDDFYGSIGWAVPLEASGLLEDSGVCLDMSQSSATPGISNSSDAGIVSPDKGTRCRNIPTPPPAKRPRMNGSGSQIVCQPQTAPVDLSLEIPLALSLHNRSQSPSQDQGTLKPQKVTCLERGCLGKRQDVDGMMKHIRESHYPPKIFLCSLCHEKFTRKDRFIGPKGHFCKKHGYPNDRALRAEYERQVITIDIEDTFCDICPFCVEDVVLDTYKDYMDHIERHLEGELQSHTPEDRCRKANHDWGNSRCIPEKYGRKKKPRQSCHASILGSNDDEDDNDEDPSGPSGPKGNGFYGFQQPWGSGNGTNQNTNTNVGQNYSGEGNVRHFSSESSTQQFCLGRKFDSSNLALFLPPRGKKLRTAKSASDLIKKCFRSVRKLGHGGFGAVDEVICTSTNKSYARKIIPLSSNKKISTEVEIMKQLSHQHIIKLAAYCTTPDELWLFVTPIAEKDLATYLRDDATWAPGVPHRELLRMWECCLVSALGYLHGGGFVHGDIKPQNVLISSNLKIYLADFGSARARYLESSYGVEATPITPLTPKYSAPEVSYYKSVGYILEMGTAADMFSLGCVWAEMETVYTGLSIQVFEKYRSDGSTYNSFQGNLARTYLWFDFLWVLQESVLQAPKDWAYAPSRLQIAKDMLNFDPDQRPTANDLMDVVRCTCSVESPTLRDSRFLFDMPFSTPFGTGSMLHWTKDFLPANQIDTTFCIEPSNICKVAMEPFSPSGLIEVHCNWVKDWPSLAPPFFLGSGAKYFGRASELSKFSVFNTKYAALHDMLIRENILETETTRHRAGLLEARKPDAVPPKHAKDFCELQCVQQCRHVPKSLESHQEFSSGSVHALHYLHDYLRETSPPSSAEDILMLWESALHVSCLKEQLKFLPDEKIHCQHYDLKPEHVLISKPKPESPYQWEWKTRVLSVSCLSEKGVAKEDDGNGNGTLDTCGANSSEENQVASSWTPDLLSLGIILLELGFWTACENGQDSDHYKWRSQSKFPLQRTDIAPEHDSCISKESEKSKQDLLKVLSERSDSLTKSIAESVIAPMLEPPDKRPSWKWIQEKSRAIFNDARDSLNHYKKTVAQVATPLVSSARSKINTAYMLSTVATDGGCSDRTRNYILSSETDPHGSRTMNAECQEDAELDPNVSDKGTGYSYPVERYLRDKRDCRYLLPGKISSGWDASKELDKIYLGREIENFERVWDQR